MRMRTGVLLSMALGSALSLAPMAWADTGPRCAGKDRMMSHYTGRGHGSATSHLLRHLMKNKHEIGLTDDQIAQLRETALDADRARIRAEADMMVSERELRSLLWDEKADMPAIEAKVKERESFEATVRIIGIRAKRELIGVLTPEQKTKLKTLWEQRRHPDRSRLMRAEADESQNEGLEADSDVVTGESERALSAG